MTTENLRIGIMPCVPGHWVALAAGRLRRRHSRLQLSLRELWTDHASLAAISTGEVDCAVVIGPVHGHGLDVRTLCELTAHAFVAPDHPLARHTGLTLDDLVDQPTFRRPDAVDPAWRAHWLLQQQRSGDEPRYVDATAQTQHDAMLIIATTRAVGYAPANWTSGAGLGVLGVPVSGGPTAPVQVVRPAGADRSLVQELVRETEVAVATALTATPAAEARVARLVCLGWTNREIATHLSVSVRTVDAQVAAILRRHGVRSRSELLSRWLSVCVVDARASTGLTVVGRAGLEPATQGL